MLQASTQMGVGRDDDRWSPGFKTSASSVTFYGGQVVTQVTTDLSGMTIQAGGISGSQGIYNNTTSPFPLGMVFEATNPPSQPIISGPSQAGTGFDTLGFAIGNVYSVFHRPGNVCDITDGQENTAQVTVNKNVTGTVAQNTSCPFITTDNFTVGAPWYYTDAGLVTVTAPTTGGQLYCRMGFVRAVSGSADSYQLTLEIEKQGYTN